jgi:hypothetical protein
MEEHQNVASVVSDPFEKLRGVYRGFAPTDESPIGVGELEITITQDSMDYRHATGLEVINEKYPLSHFVEASKEHVRSCFEPRFSEVDSVQGFFMNGLTYFFMADAKEEEDAGLVIVGSMGDILGPTFCYGPLQVMNGIYDKVAAHVNEEYAKQFPNSYPKGCFPTLAANGKMPK